MPDADAGTSAECVSPMGVAIRYGRHGKWLFPVGTVMIKNFIFDGKLVETRLFMHVDTATAALIGTGTEASGSATTTPGTRSRRKRRSSPTRVRR
jgi:hypothetical protein